ncbi:hypothetical protein WP50_15500 [Lactiplantibacillus plantarum]|nr:hypothetical protein WP50_15500 [Lactiplantibacillus plantarum]
MANNQKANKNVSKPAASAKWVKEKKTYTLKTAVKLHTSTSTSSNTIAILPAGTTVKTDQAIIKGGYRWVRQPLAGLPLTRMWLAVRTGIQLTTHGSGHQRLSSVLAMVASMLAN